MGLSPSPTAARVVNLLRFMADHPDRAHTTAELARAISENRTTCQAVLLALEDADWVRRDTGKAYSLGPGLVALTSGAVTRMPVIEELRRGADEIHQQLDVEVNGAVVVRDEMLIVARAGTDRAFAPILRIGQTMPLVPPFGLVFVAWGGDAAVDRWTAGSTTDFTAEEARRHRMAAELVRTLGYSVTFDPTTRRALGAVLAESSATPRSGPMIERRDHLVRALAHDEYLMTDPEQVDQPVSQVSVPVFDPNDEVVAALAVAVFPHQVTADKVELYVDVLRDASSRISSRLFGMPDAPPAAPPRP